MNSLKNSYLGLPERFYQKINPAIFKNPKLLIFNDQLSKELGFELEGCSKDDLAQYFSGQKLFTGSEPMALAYAAHQFGNLVPKLGDGRAHYLGEKNGFDLQLKGSGQTMFSRQGDGKSALGPVLREYIVSEAMHALGIPTTRALAAVLTNESVFRQEVEPGGIFTRVAESHLRVGTFQYYAIREDKEALSILLDYAIDRHFKELGHLNDSSQKALAFIEQVAKKQSKLIAKWTSVGFVHGVMNTDNFTISGITLDFGPCAFLDEFKFQKVFSSIDRQGRYSFFNQLPIAQWNILRLAESLIYLIDDDQNKAIELVEKRLEKVFDLFEEDRTLELSKKFGLIKANEKIVMTFLEYLEEFELDFTQSFTNLKSLYNDSESEFFPKSGKRDEFLSLWKSEKIDFELMESVNPKFIPRNHLIEEAIQNAYKNNFDMFFKISDAIKSPYSDNEEFKFMTVAPTKSKRVTQTFCGT